MKFWDTLKEDDKKYPWWLWVFFIVGLIIGIGIVALFVGALFLFLGWVFSFLWNYSIAPTFSVTEITTTVASGLLFFIFCGARLIKFLVKSQLPSSNRLGHCPFKAKIRDRAPLGVPFLGVSYNGNTQAFGACYGSSILSTPSKKFSQT